MKSNYNQLGQYIEMVSRTNSDLKYGIEDVRGCSNTKQMMQTRANLIGRTYEKFIVLRPQEFVFNRRTTRNGEKIGMAYNNTDREYIFTNDYVAFRVKQEYLDKLLPDYLYMFFCRDEFDRYARYKSTGSATEFFNWEDMCAVPFEIPPMDFQQLVVNAYKVLNERIETKQKINDNLEATVQAIFKSEFIDYERANYSDYIEFEFGKYPATWNLVDLDTAVDVRDGTHDSPSPTESGKYLITSRHLLPYAVDRSDAYFISEADFKKANERSKVEYGDILFSMIGTIGIISFITDKEVDFAIKNVGLFRTSQNPTIRYFILSYLKSKIVENYISSYMAGSTQSYVSLNVLRKIPLILPTEDVLQHFEKQVTPLYAKMIENTHEIAKLNDLKDVITTSMSSR